MQPIKGAPGWDKPKATPGRPRPGPQRTPAPSPFFSPTRFQNLTRLKRLNLDGNRLATVPALPASLQELKLNDNHLQGLQHSSFQGAGSPRGRGQKAQAWAAMEALESCARVRGGAAQGSLVGGHKRKQQQQAAPIGYAVGSGAPLPTHPAGLSQLLTLEVEGNQLHDGNISPLAFRSLGSLLYLRLDRNRLRTIPPGLPASLQVRFGPESGTGSIVAT